jgi:hypothetical protein
VRSLLRGKAQTGLPVGKSMSRFKNGEALQMLCGVNFDNPMPSHRVEKDRKLGMLRTRDSLMITKVCHTICTNSVSCRSHMRLGAQKQQEEGHVRQPI